MHKLSVLHYVCNGASCHHCEDFIPGFITEHAGEMDLDDDFLHEHDADIKAMFDECPRGALCLDEI